MGPHFEPPVGQSEASWTGSLADEFRGVLARHPHFRGRVNLFEVVVGDEVLTVRGCVPTFHLKQLVQCVLKQIAGARRIDNRIVVASCEGLSSVRHGLGRPLGREET
jgi:hypothetical protein